MTFRGSTTVADRIFASLPYLLPLINGLIFGYQFPWLQLLFLPLVPVIAIYHNLPFGSLIVFFALFFLVVRNEKIIHFIRFNTMQAILLDIILFLGNILLKVLALPGLDFVGQTIASTLFLGTVVTVGYSVFQSLNGRYAELPTISEAAYTQVR